MHIFQIKQVSAEVSVQFVKVSPKLNDLLLNHEGACVSVWIKCPWGPVLFCFVGGDKMWNGFSKFFVFFLNLTFQCSCLCLYPLGSATVPNGMAQKCGELLSWRHPAVLILTCLRNELWCPKVLVLSSSWNTLGSSCLLWQLHIAVLRLCIATYS